MENNQIKRLKDLWKCAHRRLAKRKSKIKAQFYLYLGMMRGAYNAC